MIYYRWKVFIGMAQDWGFHQAHISDAQPATLKHFTRRMLLWERVSFCLILWRCLRFLCNRASHNRHIFTLGSIAPLKSQLRMCTFECFCEGLDYFSVCVVLESHKNVIYWSSVARSSKDSHICLKVEYFHFSATTTGYVYHSSQTPADGAN